MKSIDCTPTWEGLLPMLLELYEAKNVKPAKRAETRKEMGIELRRMAQAADKWNAHVKDMEAATSPELETLGDLPWEKDTEGGGKGQTE